MKEYIRIDNKSNAELGFIVRGTSQRPGLPPTIDRMLSIPGRNGVLDFGADVGVRTFYIDCAFLTKNPLELQEKIMSLAQYLVDSYGKPRTVSLRFVERPEQYFSVRFMGTLDIERIAGAGTFTLPLVAFDPFAYSDRQHIIETTMDTSPFEVEAVSNGDVRTEPVIVLTNQGSTTITHFTIVNEYRLE